ncbi:MAG: methyltransferase domain-containing protein [Leptospiraceae bacterium]|nr:methyltransferase domain-containing protein [Leptospiraceae bacterium]
MYSFDLAEMSLGEWHHMWVRLKDGDKFDFFTKVESFLDVGCGNGRYIRYFSKNVNLIVGVDINKSVFPKKSGFNFIVADVHHLPFKNDSFELVFSTDVLEHLCKPSQALQEMWRVSRNKIYLCTPNKLCPIDMSKIASWFGTHKRPTIENYVIKHELSSMLKNAGFRDLLITTRSFLPLGWLVEHKKAKIPKRVAKFMLQIESCLERLPFIKNLAGVLIAMGWK